MVYWAMATGVIKKDITNNTWTFTKPPNPDAEEGTNDTMRTPQARARSLIKQGPNMVYTALLVLLNPIGRPQG